MKTHKWRVSNQDLYRFIVVLINIVQMSWLISLIPLNDSVDEEDMILLEATSSGCDDEVIITTDDALSERNETAT